MKLLAQLLNTIIQSNLKLKPNKCVFGTSSVIFLGHIISEDGIKQDPTKLAALQELEAPSDVKGETNPRNVFLLQEILA